ncbi:hypothetical protein PCANB_001442 [Pneumocystis canis]|nr:hypothetical protein PCANB_001442 [Pneumocystis canis]
MSIFKLPSKERLREVSNIVSRVFGTTFNPESRRTGNRVLRQRFRGSVLLDYYSQMNIPLKRIIKAFPQLKLVDYEEEKRKMNAEIRRRRGKGPPPKLKGKQESKSKQKKR